MRDYALCAIFDAFYFHNTCSYGFPRLRHYFEHAAFIIIMLMTAMLLVFV